MRGAFLLLALFVVLASRFGLEAILGAFLAGATLKLVDRDEGMMHAFFHGKLEAAGVDLGLIRPENYDALVAAGLLSVIAFPLVALTLLRARTEPSAVAELPARPSAA